MSQFLDLKVVSVNFMRIEQSTLVNFQIEDYTQNPYSSNSKLKCCMKTQATTKPSHHLSCQVIVKTTQYHNKQTKMHLIPTHKTKWIKRPYEAQKKVVFELEEVQLLLVPLSTISKSKQTGQKYLFQIDNLV